jgi:hypothetical protein
MGKTVQQKVDDVHLASMQRNRLDVACGCALTVAHIPLRKAQPAPKLPPVG